MMTKVSFDFVEGDVLWVADKSVSIIDIKSLVILKSNELEIKNVPTGQNLAGDYIIKVKTYLKDFDQATRTDFITVKIAEEKLLS